MYSATATAFLPGVNKTGIFLAVAAAISVLAAGSFRQAAIIFKLFAELITSFVILSNSMMATSTSANLLIKESLSIFTPVMAKPPCSTLKPAAVNRLISV